MDEMQLSTLVDVTLPCCWGLGGDVRDVLCTSHADVLADGYPLCRPHVSVYAQQRHIILLFKRIDSGE